MRIMAMIQSNIVVNIALWDGISQWDPGPEYELIDVTSTVCIDGTPVIIGCDYDGTNFYPPSGD
jgi:hypothetical protein